MSQKSVLIISSEFPPNVGGIGNHAYNLAKSLANEGYSVTVMCDTINIERKTLVDFEAKENFRIIWTKRSRFLPKTYFSRVIRAPQCASGADVIICSGKFSLWLGIIIRVFYSKKKLIAIVHGSELDLKSRPAKKLTDYALNKFDSIISVSNYTQQFLPATLKKSINKNVIPNGINLSDFQNATSTNPIKGDPSLITVGSITQRKGQENVVQALPYIKNFFPGAHYHMVGKPANRQQVEVLSEQLGVADRVSFYGAIDMSEMKEKVASAKIKMMLSVHTSDGDFEGFGIAILEANALGVPAIGTRNSGIADAIDDGKTGLLVDPHNPHEISAAIKEICDNYTFYSDNAKQWAVQHDWKNILRSYIKVLSN